MLKRFNHQGISNGCSSLDSEEETMRMNSYTFKLNKLTASLTMVMSIKETMAD